jgi:serine/threonine protein kinase
MEYSDGGNVQEYVKRSTRMPEPMAQRLLLQLVEAVTHCHAQRVCHRDLKLENFVLNKQQTTLKLIDFGLSVVWAQGKDLFKSYGTPCYTAPEIIGGKRYLGPQVDVWSLGVSLCTMLTGTLPFQAIGASELNRRILRGQFMLPEYLSAEAADLIRQMLTLSPERRVTLDGIRAHPWLRGVPEVVEPQQQHSAAAAAAAELDGHGGAPAAPRADGAPQELDEQILKQVEQLGFSAELVSQSVRAKAYDHPSACYHMLRRKAAAAACQPVAW